jgi:hypothetical protein
MRAFTLSMALVEQMIRWISASKARKGTNSAQAFSRSFAIAGYRLAQASANFRNRSVEAASVGAVETGLRALAIASQCWRAA